MGSRLSYTQLHLKKMIEKRMPCKQVWQTVTPFQKLISTLDQAAKYDNGKASLFASIQSPNSTFALGRFVGYGLAFVLWE
jgi:hypothetical protein